MHKTPTGIAGFDEITNGGLPSGRATLLEGGPGTGKTLFALQTLINGARHCDEPGIFVAFEEGVDRIAANVSGFGWDLDELQKRQQLFLLDGQPSPELIQSGQFDLAGLLAALEAKIAQIGAKRIVLDALDVVLALCEDARERRREAYRIHNWLLAKNLTALITAKSSVEHSTRDAFESPEFLQFMVDCAVTLNHEIIDSVSQRNLRIRKYRGSSFEENVTPFIMGANGIEVAYTRLDGEAQPVTTERVSTGIQRLDTMLGGGYYRGASVLLTGSPGTAKTTLCGTFAQAACGRGEKTLFVSFDSPSEEILRNLESVKIRLRDHVKSERLLMLSAHGLSGSAEIHLMRIKEAAREHEARCIVIDPISALAKTGNRGAVHSVAERLINWTRSQAITLLCTSLLDHAHPDVEGTPMQISTLADTWIHLSYLVQAGERNRGLSIIKSRGTGHSSQVRELVLSSEGVSLKDVYTAGGEVLMGTMRWAKEREERLAHEERRSGLAKRKRAFETELAELENRAKTIQEEVDHKRAELERLSQMEQREEEELSKATTDLRKLRGSNGSSDS